VEAVVVVEDSVVVVVDESVVVVAAVVVVAEALVEVVVDVEDTWLLWRIRTTRTARERASRKRMTIGFVEDQELISMDRKNGYL